MEMKKHVIKKHCNIDREDKTAVVVFTKLSHFDMFNIY